MTLPSSTTVSPAFPVVWTSERLTGTNTVLVAVEGELDRHTASALRDHLEWWLGGGCTRLVLDTGAVTFADAGAHDVLRALGRRAIARRCQVVVAVLGPPLQRLLAVLGTPEGITLERW